MWGLFPVGGFMKSFSKLSISTVVLSLCVFYCSQVHPHGEDTFYKTSGIQKPTKVLDEPLVYKISHMVPSMSEKLAQATALSVGAGVSLACVPGVAEGVVVLFTSLSTLSAVSLSGVLPLLIGPVVSYAVLSKLYGNTATGLYFKAKDLYDVVATEVEKDGLLETGSGEDMNLFAITKFGPGLGNLFKTSDYFKKRADKLKKAFEIADDALSKAKDSEVEQACIELKNCIALLSQDTLEKLKRVLECPQYLKQIDDAKKEEERKREYKKLQEQWKREEHQRALDRAAAIQNGNIGYNVSFQNKRNTQKK